MTPLVVSLDAGNTLFTERASRAALYAEAFAAVGADVSVDELAAWMSEAHGALGDTVDGGPRYSVPWFRAFVATLLRRADCDTDPEDVRHALERVFTDPSTYVVFDDVFPALDELAQRGVRLAVTSNWSDRLPGLLEDLQLAPYFETLVVSQLVGHAKPDVRIFHDLARRTACDPGLILHVGDQREDDLHGARRAGLAARLVDRTPGALCDPDVLSSLLDLRALFDD
ncbi:MAG: HAD-IA family hydrolase [Planctomycetes bacterium]|nr:HAD-IA family hydrolase [Planctomycetota bacterium]